MQRVWSLPSVLRRMLIALGAVLLSLCALSAVAGAPAAAATSSVAVTFQYNGTTGADGAPQKWLVPANVHAITADVYGAQGGALSRSNTPPAPVAGMGGYVHAVLAVTPGQVLSINVGGRGGEIGVPCGGGFCYCQEPGIQFSVLGGYDGGGRGGDGHCPGGGGGGASDIRSGTGTLADRMTVAGGGGGAANACGPAPGCADGGHGGGNTGDPGISVGVGGSVAGGGGTQTGGGSAVSGSAGSFGVGGPGAFGDPAGGGAGGGWYGGGGGGARPSGAAGGGGGSGHAVAVASQVTMTSGVRLGNGVVSVAYVPNGNVFATTFKNCNTLHVGYNYFVSGTVVHWRVTSNGVGTVASGQFSAIGGGNLGSKTYHFLDIALGTTLPSEASGIQSHVLFTWANGGRFYATRDPGC